MIQIHLLNVYVDYVGLMQERKPKVSNSLTQVTHDMDSQTQALEAQAEEFKTSSSRFALRSGVASRSPKAYQEPKRVFKSL